MIDFSPYLCFFSGFLYMKLGEMILIYFDIFPSIVQIIPYKYRKRMFLSSVVICIRCMILRNKLLELN